MGPSVVGPRKCTGGIGQKARGARRECAVLLRYVEFEAGRA